MSNINSRLGKFESSIDSLNLEVKSIAKSNSKLQSRLDTHTTETNNLGLKVNILEENQSKLNTQLDVLSVRLDTHPSEHSDTTESLHSRITQLKFTAHNTDLIISGIPELLNENLGTLISSLMAMLQVTWDPNMNISELGRFYNANKSNKPRPIYLRLNSSHMRDKIISAKKSATCFPPSCRPVKTLSEHGSQTGIARVRL